MSDRDFCEDDDEIDVSEEDDDVELNKTKPEGSVSALSNAEHVRERNNSEVVLETDSAHSQSDENNESDNEVEHPSPVQVTTDKTIYTPDYYKLFAQYTGQTQLMCS